MATVALAGDELDLDPDLGPKYGNRFWIILDHFGHLQWETSPLLQRNMLVGLLRSFMFVPEPPLVPFDPAINSSASSGVEHDAGENCQA